MVQFRIVGQAASTGKHQWIFSDASDGGWNSAASIGGQDIFQVLLPLLLLYHSLLC